LNIELPKANYYPDFYILTQLDVVAISNSSFSFVASMLNERAKFFCRPSLLSNKIIPFDPWDSYVLLIEKKENLPDSGYKARITTTDSLVVAKGDTLTISVKVQNLSDVTWQRSCVSCIVLACGWLDEKKNVVQEHDCKGSFKEDLQPGEETEVSLKISAPSLEGRFILELDMLDEDITWFKDKGSETAKVNVLVEPVTKVVEVEQKWQLKTPVAFFIYKRPDTTEKVFEAIRQAKPPKLLVVADGPKADVSGETEKCMKTRAIIDKVDWDCEVITNYSETNLGCRQRVASGLDWVFEQVESAIILEDDCFPNPTFFRFCEELLDCYRDDERVMQISGNNIQFGNKRTKDSYYFSIYNRAWGWASWRRAWNHYDVNMTQWEKLKNTNWLEYIFKDKQAAKLWSERFVRTYEGIIDTWDHQWRLNCWIRNGLSIVPSVNLITNIGFTAEGTHCKNPNDILANLPQETIFFPLKHPHLVERHLQADEFEETIRYSRREQKKLERIKEITPNFDTTIFPVQKHFVPEFDELIIKAEQEFDRHFKRKLVRDILAIGHPRCGSKYMSELFKTIGLDVGHESMGDQGISSWMFAVYDENNPWAKDKYAVSRFYTDFDFLIQYVRHPGTAIPSIIIENQYAPDSFEFRKKHFIQAFGGDIFLDKTELEKAIVSFIKWNQIIKNQNPDLTVKIESCEAEVITFLQENNLVSKELSVDQITTPSKDVNSKKPYKGQIYQKPKVTAQMWNEVKPELKKELNQFCQTYDYPKLYDDNWEYLDEKELITKQADSVETNNQLIFFINPGKSGSNSSELFVVLPRDATAKDYHLNENWLEIF
jgi:hypothetical protein